MEDIQDCPICGTESSVFEVKMGGVNTRICQSCGYQTNEGMVEGSDVEKSIFDSQPELFKDFSSPNCDFNIDVSYGENAFIVRFNYYDKLYNQEEHMEYLLYKNRTIGDDYHDMNNHVNIEITKRLDDINIDFMTFVEFRLK